MTDRERRIETEIRALAARIFEQLCGRPAHGDAATNFDRMARNAYRAAEAFHQVTGTREAARRAAVDPNPRAADRG